MLESWKPTCFLDSFPGGLMLAYVAGRISTDLNFWERTASPCVSPCPRHFNVGSRANERPLRLIAHRRVRFSHLCLYQHWHWGQGELIESSSKRVAFRLPSTTSWLSSDLASLAVLMLCIVTVVTCGWDPVARVPSISAGTTLRAPSADWFHQVLELHQAIQLGLAWTNNWKRVTKLCVGLLSPQQHVSVCWGSVRAKTVTVGTMALMSPRFLLQQQLPQAVVTTCQRSLLMVWSQPGLEPQIRRAPKFSGVRKNQAVGDLARA